jgi:hypothetical protein
MLNGLSDINMCDNSRGVASMDRQTEYCLGVVMCDGKNEWLKQFEVSIVGIRILSRDLVYQMVWQIKQSSILVGELNYIFLFFNVPKL